MLTHGEADKNVLYTTEVTAQKVRNGGFMHACVTYSLYIYIFLIYLCMYFLLIFLEQLLTKHVLDTFCDHPKRLRDIQKTSKEHE